MSGLAGMLGHPFVRYAFLAGTGVAAAAGMAGYFLVLRAQVFTADALSHVAVAGAMAALAFGVDARLGLFAGTILVALALGLLGPRGRPDDVVIGSLFAWILGLGVAFLALYTTSRSGGNGAASVTVLFGSIFGLNRGQAITAAALGAGTVLTLAFIARPLLFASVDEAVARARGVPVSALGLGFLVLAGVTAAEATQVVGALLLLGLVAAPAGAAQRLTTRPFRALWLSAGLAIGALWVGLVLSYALPRVPPSFAIVATSVSFYALAGLTTRSRRRGSAPERPAATMAAPSEMGGDHAGRHPGHRRRGQGAGPGLRGPGP